MKNTLKTRVLAGIGVLGSMLSGGCVGENVINWAAQNTLPVIVKNGASHLVPAKSEVVNRYPDGRYARVNQSQLTTGTPEGRNYSKIPDGLHTCKYLRDDNGDGGLSANEIKGIDATVFNYGERVKIFLKNKFRGTIAIHQSRDGNLKPIDIQEKSQDYFVLRFVNSKPGDYRIVFSDTNCNVFGKLAFKVLPDPKNSPAKETVTLKTERTAPGGATIE